eukprot:g2570.t1
MNSRNRFLAITALPTPNRWGHASNASKLLGAYTLLVNGRPLGTGPGRRVGGGLNVDVYNVTELLAPGASRAGRQGAGAADVYVPAAAEAKNNNLIEISAFYGTSALQKQCQPGYPFPAGGDPQDCGGVLAAVFGGDGTVLAHTGDGRWQAFDATLMMNPTANWDKSPAKKGDYWAPGENWNMLHAPSSYSWSSSSSSSSSSSGWQPAVPRDAPAGDLHPARLVPKDAAPIALRRLPAARILPAPTTTAAAAAAAAAAAGQYGDRTAGTSIVQVFDLGINIQGGLNVSITNPGSSPVTIEVRLGEELNADGSAMCCPARSGNEYRALWTLAPGGGSRNSGGGGEAAAEAAAAAAAAAANRIVMHEYAEFRYVEFRNLPRALTLAEVEAWVVRYPFDGDLNEGAAASDDIRVNPRATTRFAVHSSGSAGRRGAADTTGVDHGAVDASASAAALESVWQLSKWTIEGASLDVNTDSNTRQRDVCTWDAYLATIEQGAVSPAGSAPLRRRMVQFMYEAGSYVNSWTEFEVAHVFALAAFGFDYNDYGADAGSSSSSSTSSSSSSSKVRQHLDAARAHSLVDTVSTKDGLAHCTPKPIIDWPRSALIDITGTPQADMCDEVCAPMNAHVATAVDSMADMAARVGRAAEAANYSRIATGVAAAMGRAFAAAGAACDPPAPACFTDEPNNSVGDNNKDNDNDHGRKKPTTTTTTTVQSSIFPLALPSRLLPALRQHAVAATANHNSTSSWGLGTDDNDDKEEGGGGGQAKPGLLAVLPFLKARNERQGRVMQASPWATGFMLRGLLQLALGADGAPPDASAASAAAEYVHAVLTATGENSWRQMMTQFNASMTMEAWSPKAGSGTMSHPWNAAPAYLVPHWVMGVRPLEPAYRRVLVAPMPSRALAAAGAGLRMPTLRGEITVSLSWGANRSGGGGSGGNGGGGSNGSSDSKCSVADCRASPQLAVEVGLPGNTAARVCVPAYLFSTGASDSTSDSHMPNVQLAVDGASISSGEVAWHGGALCLEQDIRGGQHKVVATAIVGSK